MTQKEYKKEIKKHEEQIFDLQTELNEYKEKIEKYEKQLIDLQAELNEEKNKNFNYLEVLERNYQLQKELVYERNKNDIACRNIDELNDIIDKYQKIIDKFTINF